MYPLIRKCWLGSVAASALALTVASLPAHATAEELVNNPGPVTPNQPILTTVGSKRVIAFYEENGNRCGMQIVVWDRADVSGGSATRVRMTLEPRARIYIDSPENKSLGLQCGEHADSLAVVDTQAFIAAGAAQ